MKAKLAAQTLFLRPKLSMGILPRDILFQTGEGLSCVT